MSPYRRNVLLGATILIGLGVLAWMILQFGASVASVFGPPTMKVSMITSRADGVADGSPILYLGLEAGHVTGVRLDDDKKRVHIDAVIYREPPLPSNIVGAIKTASLLGAGSAITLEVQGEPSGTLLKENDIFAARFVGFGDVLPAEYGALAVEITATLRQVRESNVIHDIDEQVNNAGKLITSLQEIAGNQQTQDDLKKSIANLREITESAKTLAAKLDHFADDLNKTTANVNDTMADARKQVTRAGDNIETLSRQMGDRLTQIAKLLDQFQSIAQKIDKGEGTAGALINDSKLYESLVDTSRELNATIKDLKRLTEQWEQEGVSLKLK